MGRSITSGTLNRIGRISVETSIDGMAMDRFNRLLGGGWAHPLWQ
ncbi:hypothetical protein [Polaromonas sp.]|nr:hypothetical protein [Polaromonas sp.]